MATSGTYVTEVPLKGTTEKHYKRWRNENHIFPDAVGHHIQSVAVHDGEWDSHGAIKIWNYTLDGKPEVFKERRELDDETKTVTSRGLEGHVMEQLKVMIILNDGKKFRGRTCLYDEDNDLALVKIVSAVNPIDKMMTFIPIGFGISDTPEVGSVVLSMGYPEFFSNSITMGVVSAIHTSQKGKCNIQTDCAVIEGYNGGPLVNLDGKLIGISFKNEKGVGVRFAIAIDTGKEVMRSWKIEVMED